MQCLRCGRLERRLKTARGPDGRLLFDWCEECLFQLQSEVLGLAGTDPAGDVPIYSQPIQPADMTVAWREVDPSRAVGMRVIGLILACWGLILEGVAIAAWFADPSGETGVAPSAFRKGPIFTVSGGVLALTGAWLGLLSVHVRWRRRIIALALEVVAVVCGFGTLLLGIFFHDTRRNPLIVSIVAVAAIVAILSRFSRRHHDAKPKARRTLIP